VADHAQVPQLTVPTAAVRESFLRGEAEAYADEGLTAESLQEASRDFDSWVAQRAVDRIMWGVPTTELWLVDAVEYLGAVVIRHQLTPALLAAGGNLGYHVVPAHRRRGHATAMVAQALDVCRSFGMTRVLVTCLPENAASRRVIEANGGVYEDERSGESRYWIEL